MQQTLLIVLIEILLVVLIALIVLLLLNWRRNMRCHAALEHLLDDVRERQGRRGEKIVSCLTEQYKLDQGAARELSVVLFAAEKLFLAQFIEQQMQQQSVEGFYENLCELLDSYLNAMPKAVAADQQPGATAIPEAPEPGDAEEMQEVGFAAGGEPPPEWGDVFD